MTDATQTLRPSPACDHGCALARERDAVQHALLTPHREHLAGGAAVALALIGAAFVMGLAAATIYGIGRAHGAAQARAQMERGN